MSCKLTVSIYLKLKLYANLLFELSNALCGQCLHHCPITITLEITWFRNYRLHLLYYKHALLFSLLSFGVFIIADFVQFSLQPFH